MENSYDSDLIRQELDYFFLLEDQNALDARPPDLSCETVYADCEASSMCSQPVHHGW
jgi:hypothetical protein